MKHYLSTLSEIENAVSSAGRILIACDFDGTLCPIEKSPDGVMLSDAATETLWKLIDADITLAIISGRSIEDLAERVPFDIILAGNHGLEIHCDGIDFKQPTAVSRESDVRAACEVLKPIVRNRPGAWVENKGLSATVHYRNVESSDIRPLLFAVRRRLSEFGTKLAFRAGKKAFEIRPAVGWDKGSALEYIQTRKGPFDLCICIGDDRTDESMFRANRGQLNVKVGCSGFSAATQYVSDAHEAITFLDHIAATRATPVGAESQFAGQI
jgi:trehalose 6-phosphate phosphatase